jgi:hypothetical protein
MKYTPIYLNNNKLTIKFQKKQLNYYFVLSDFKDLLPFFLKKGKKKHAIKIFNKIVWTNNLTINNKTMFKQFKYIVNENTPYINFQKIKKFKKSKVDMIPVLKEIQKRYKAIKILNNIKILLKKKSFTKK